MSEKPADHRLGAQMALELVSDKWTVLVMNSLKGGTRRYSELQREIEGISQRMLTHTLRNMERDGLLTRVVYPVVPPKTEYSLTPLGQTLVEPLRILCHWATQNYGEILEARRLYDEKRVEGELL